jgi:hypothetical protein
VRPATITKRAKVLHYVMLHPGCNINQASLHAGAHPVSGSLHVRDLRRAGFVKATWRSQNRVLRTPLPARPLHEVEELIRTRWPGQGARRSRILQAVGARPGMSARETSRATGIPEPTVRRDVAHLVRFGELRVWRHGKAKVLGLPGQPRPLPRLSPTVQATLDFITRQSTTQGGIVEHNLGRGITRAATQRSLHRLEALNLIRSKREGRTRQYRIVKRPG